MSDISWRYGTIDIILPFIYSVTVGSTQHTIAFLGLAPTNLILSIILVVFKVKQLFFSPVHTEDINGAGIQKLGYY
jgi:hypothetical protein